MRILRPALSSKRRSRILETSLTANSAAADGVGARKSDTKSIMVKSVSCPTADMTGVLQLNTSLATHSSLNAHKSSIEPPPPAYDYKVNTGFIKKSYSGAYRLCRTFALDFGRI